MLFRKKDEKPPLKYPTAASFWTESKVSSIAEHLTIEISLSSFIEVRCAGRMASYTAPEESQEGHGVVEWPRCLAMITFSDRPIQEHAPPKPPTIGMWQHEAFGSAEE